MSCSDIFLGLIAVLFPPIAVWIKVGLCTADSLINIGLCMLGYVPGLLHAWYIIAKHPEPDYDYETIDAEDGSRRRQRVTYYYVSHEDGGRRSTTRGGGAIAGPGAGGNQSGRGQQQSYGTTAAAASAAAPARAPAASTKKSSSSNQQTGITHGEGSSHLAGPSVGAGEDDAGAPPSYSEVVRGDNKIQSQH